MLAQDIVHVASSMGCECLPMSHAELDITDLPEVRAAVVASAPDVVVNCAAWTDVDGAEIESEAALAINGMGAENVARASQDAGAWTIQISSDYVFDGFKRTPYVESDPTGPLSAYGRSKLAGEVAVAEAAPGTHTIVRSSWLFGAGGRCFPATILRLATERDELAVVDDQIGSPTFTGHLAAAVLAVAQSRPRGVLHLAGRGACSWFEFAQEIVALAELDCELKPSTTAEQNRPAPRPPYSVLGTERDDIPELPAWRQGLGEYMKVGLRL